MPNSVALIDIFNSRKKSDLIALCRDMKIDAADLANVVIAAKVGVLPLMHISVHREIVRGDLSPTDKDFSAYAEAIKNVKPGEPIGGAAKRFINKIDQTFKQRRLLNGHLFVAPGMWHLFYFDQRDTSQLDSHWEGGSHIHLMNWLTHPQMAPETVLSQLDCEKPKLAGRIHIRYSK